jgi:Na+/H+ antiporter NhaC
MGVITSSLNKAWASVSPPYELYLKSIPYNFYAIVMILISIGVIVFNFGFRRIISRQAGGRNSSIRSMGIDEAHEQCSLLKKARRPGRSI